MSIVSHPAVSFVRRRHRFVLAVAAAAGLGGLCVTGYMERFFYYPIRGRTEPPPHLAAESVRFSSRDGTALHGWLIPAAGVADRRSAPTILHFHGTAGNIESHIFFTEHLPPAGFNVFIFDYRGYGRSEGRARRRGKLIEDGHAALDALLSRPDIDPSRIGMYAQSLGAAIGLCVMAERAEIRAAVIESSFASWRLMAATALGGDPPGPFSRAIAGLFIRDDHRPDEAIARIDRPILIVHGTADSIIPVSHGRRLAAQARSAELVEIEGGDHNTLRETHPEVDELTIDFLRRHLTPRPD